MKDLGTKGQWYVGFCTIRPPGPRGCHVVGMMRRPMSCPSFNECPFLSKIDGSHNEVNFNVAEGDVSSVARACDFNRVLDEVLLKDAFLLENLIYSIDGVPPSMKPR